MARTRRPFAEMRLAYGFASHLLILEPTPFLRVEPAGGNDPGRFIVNLNVDDEKKTPNVSGERRRGVSCSDKALPTLRNVPF
jgi:hypothetical protein